MTPKCPAFLGAAERGTVPRAAKPANGGGGDGKPFGKQTELRQDQKCDLISKGKKGASSGLKGKGSKPRQGECQMWLGQEWGTKRELKWLLPQYRAEDDTPGGTILGTRSPHPLQPTSDSRRMLRFSLLPDLGPFPLVGFCSGMVTSGAGRRVRMHSADLCYHPGPPDRRAGQGRRLFRLGFSATETELERTLAGRGAPLLGAGLQESSPGKQVWSAVFRIWGQVGLSTSSPKRKQRGMCPED